MKYWNFSVLLFFSATLSYILKMGFIRTEHNEAYTKGVKFSRIFQRCFHPSFWQHKNILYRLL